MIFRLVVRSFAAEPVRSSLLAIGFGLGIGAMAGLLGVGEVILEQAGSPALAGGGDLVIHGHSGNLDNPRFFLRHVLDTEDIAAASPSVGRRMYLIEPGRSPLAVSVRAGIPSREEAVGDPETAGHPAWSDSPADRAWVAPAAGELLREMDRFHPIPERVARDPSWLEWLYFNGRLGDTRFYLTFAFGREVEPGRRSAGVRLQLDGPGGLRMYSDRGVVDANELLASAPDVTVAGASVRLVDDTYRIRLRLREEQGAGVLEGALELRAEPGRSLPPVEVNGADGWISGYTAPVTSGRWSGRLGETALDGAAGYHDHNWGFWSGVTWEWGQVAEGDRSIVYGRIRPPADVLDPRRLPAFLLVLGAEGVEGYANDVTIEERGDGEVPDEISVEASGAGVELAMRLEIEDAIRTGNLFGGEIPRTFLQMKAAYSVRGVIAGESLDFMARGSAETFRAGAKRGL